MKITKELVIQAWVSRGIKDFYISFELEDADKWHGHSTFLCHQGLEKISKAYLLATKSTEYENLQAEAAKHKINKIAKDFGHELGRLICQLMLANVLSSEDIAHNGRFYGKDLIEILEKAYIESRYPVPNPSCKKYPVANKYNLKMYDNPLGGTALINYARKLALAIMKKIESDFSVTISREKISSKIDDADWQRFYNIFWGQ